MRVAVTGGAGFIGSNLARALRSAGHETTVLDDLSTGRRDNLDGIDAELVVGSILDPTALDAVLDGRDAVIHLAGRGSVPRSLAEPLATNAVNVSGTLEVLEAARRAGSPHVVVASSSSVYGSNPKLPRSEADVPMPVSPYAVSKLATEQYALAYGSSFDIDVLAFRFFNVYGPHQPAGHAYAAVVPAFISAALAGNPLPVHGDGEQTRDFTFVGSVARVLVDAVERRVTAAEPVNLAFGSRVSLTALVGHLECVLDRTLQIEHLPTRAGDVRDSHADDRRLRELFPDVEPVSLDEGLRATVDWFRRS